ncbi:MAG: zinc-dependent metalloprotease [Candidatus Symbiothrix sp.]|jgi:hypothetical protein|nr:zinc-dependent metalloprotease [Candidatus Symbiothrix sp.]
MFKRNLFIAVFLCAGIISASAQKQLFLKKKKQPAKKETVVAPKPAPAPASEFKPYTEIITKEAKTNTGFLKVHKVKDKFYFEMPDSIFGRDILVVNRISKAPVSSRKSLTGYAGDQIGENVVRFEKKDNKIFLYSISYIEESNDTSGMYLSVKNSNIQPIVATFQILTFKTDTTKKSKTPVFEVTGFFNSDNSITGFDSRVKRQRGVGSFFGDRSYIDTIKAYPMNLEIATVKTFMQTAPQGTSTATNQAMAANMPTDPMTYELNTSMVLLPKEPMKPRLFDPRVGYFAVSYTDFDSNPQGIEHKAKITRWRLEPKPEDREKYFAGELVEPQQPIIIYIDPTTPKKWAPYLKMGVNDWQKAFEKAGFKNAIIAMDAPNDSTWSLEDARHSAIVYKPSDIANASGPHVHDPRSGEIIETHINWYHNVMQLLHNWYAVQASPLDTGAQKLLYDDELMGQLIRFVSSHEVGHTLGLRHNFGSSATVPVEKLRDKAWVEANGHTPSIMDYARFNYVAQPEDHIAREGIFPRIGIYDEWAIEWGYRLYDQFETADDETPFLNQQIIDKLNSDKRYTFGTETDPDDPRNQNEDLGDNAVQAGLYGIKNLQRIVPNIIAWTYKANEGYDKAAELYTEVAGQFGRYAGHVAKNVAGIYRTPISVEQNANAVEYVPKNIQKEAVQFLNKQVFKTPEWLIDKILIEKAGVNPVNTISQIDGRVINSLISRRTLDKMLLNEAYNGTKAYTTTEFFTDLKAGVWAELTNGQPIDIYRRNLQKQYVSALIALVKPAAVSLQTASSSSLSDASAIARTQLLDLQRALKIAANSATGVKRSHLVDLDAKIKEALEAK